MWLIWIVFIVLILGLLALDLGVFHRKSHVVSVREALAWTAVWMALGFAFTGVVYYLFEHHWGGSGTSLNPQYPHDGKTAAQMYLAGYLLEKSLSIDNIFVIALIFSYFRVPQIHQHRVLYWGILGALIMRGVMIGIGTEMVKHFWWMTIVFGVLLIVTAIKLLFHSDENVDPEHNLLVRLARRIYPTTSEYDGAKFFTQHNGKRVITPMFLCLLVIESTDLIFAVDSIPAVIGITHDPFLVFTSNVFAILGLRSLYFALAGMMDKFRYLKYSLVVLLLFIGVKMLIEFKVHITVSESLGIIAVVLAIGIGASMLASRRGQTPNGSTPNGSAT